MWVNIELLRSYCSRLYSLIISTAHTESTNNHEQLCEICEPRNHIASQDVITWLNHKISPNVHQHDAYGCVSTQTIQRRVIFSDIYGCGGVLLFILDFIIVLFLLTNYDLYYCTLTYFYSKVIFVFKSFPHSFYYYIPPMT